MRQTQNVMRVHQFNVFSIYMSSMFGRSLIFSDAIILMDKIITFYVM